VVWCYVIVLQAGPAVVIISRHPRLKALIKGAARPRSLVKRLYSAGHGGVTAALEKLRGELTLTGEALG